MLVENQLAEREGFEPPVRLPVLRISSAARSTTLPPLQSRRVEAGAACSPHARRWQEPLRARRQVRQTRVDVAGPSLSKPRATTVPPRGDATIARRVSGLRTGGDSQLNVASGRPANASI